MNRRDFLKTAAGAGAAIGLAHNTAAAAPGMFISLNSSLVGNKVQWPEFARLAAKIGYGGTDINLNGAMKEGLDATKTLLAETKLKPGYCNLPIQVSRGDDEAFQKGLETLDEQVKFAAAIGCTRMISILPPGSQTPKEELRKTLQTRFAKVGETLAKYKVRCGFEFLGPLHLRQRAPHEFIWQMNEMLAFAKDCGPMYGLLLDSWHWHHAGATVDDILKAGKSAIVVVHVSDAAKLPPEEVRDNARLMPGEGVIDLIGFFKALKQIGYVDNVSPEPNGRVPKEMSAEEGAKLGYDTTRAVMLKAGIEV